LNTAEESSQLQGFKILVVDDSADNQFLIGRLLKKRGAHVEVADNGLDGVAKALVGEYTIVLMDIQMPEMDGYSATEKLRECGYKRPIIALTAHAMPEAKNRCLEAGCSDHITKPVSSVELTEKIIRWAPRP
jgi:two-component system, sensor histidine kinase